MKLIKFLLICLLVFPGKLIAQPGALYPSFGQGGVVVTTQSRTAFENILPLANGQFLVTDHELSVRHYENGATESYTWSKFWRYNADGTLDVTYGNDGMRRFFSSDEYHQYFTSFAVLTDGRIVATEGAQVLGSPVFPLNRIWIFNADGTGGSILAELSVAGYFSVNLNHITVDKNNRIVVTGYVRGIMSSDRNKTYIARLLADGNFDETFNNVGFRVLVENSSFNYSGELVATDAGNNIIIVEEGNYNALPGFYISKFLANGPMETSFGNVKSVGTVSLLVTDGNSEIIYLDAGTIKRLNSNGTPDVSFPSASMSIRKLLVQPDNKVIAIGSGTSSGHSVFKVARYLAAGTLDPAFGTNGTVITDLNFNSGGQDAILRNRILYVSGSVAPLFGHGTIVAYDASDVRMTCPTPSNPYSVNTGQCYATVNGINAVMSSSTLYANVQHTMVHNGTTVTGEGGVAGRQFQLGTTQVTYSYTDITTQTCSFSITVTDQDPPVARCKNVTVQLNATGNGTLTAAEVNNGSTDGCGIQSMSLSKTSFTCSDASPQTVTLTVTDIHGNSSNCTATVTVEDNVAPQAKCKNLTVYLDASGNASITAAQIDDGSTDACGIKTIALDKTTFNCSNKGSNTVTLTVTDNNDNVATCTATVTVLDTIPPIITAVVPTPSAIWPSDRKMKTVSIATTATDNCDIPTCGITAVTIKSGVFPNDNIGPDSAFIPGTNTVDLRAEIPKKGVKRIYTVTVTCTDASSNSSSSTTDVIVAHNITSPVSGATVKIGSTVNLAGEFWDIPGKKHTAKWLIDDKAINGTVKEPSGLNNGTVTGSYKFSTAGVYKIQMNVTDQNGITSYSNTSENLEAIVVVYDPNGGYTYGGGSFWSSPGKLKNNLSAAGDVSYGFTVNYYKGASLPKGETQFNFKLGDFEYNALTFDYLSISGSKAQFKGTGKIIGGQSGINFIMTVIDGQLNGTGADKVRIKIYNKNTGYVYYDNQPGAGDAAEPVTTVGPNSTVVISNNLITRTSSAPDEGNGLEVTVSSDPVSALNIKRFRGFEATAFPNPARNIFNVQVKSSDAKEKIMLQVYDVQGRLLEVRNNIQPGTLIQIGEMYRPGVYYLRIQQAGLHKELRLVKM